MRKVRYDILCGAFAVVTVICLVGLPLAHRGESTCVPGSIMHRLLRADYVANSLTPITYNWVDWLEFALHVSMFILGLACFFGAQWFRTPGRGREILALGTLAAVFLIAYGAKWYAYRYECFFCGLLLTYSLLVLLMTFMALFSRMLYLVYSRHSKSLPEAI